MQPTLVTENLRYWRILPDSRLRDVVSCYWVVDHHFGSAVGQRTGLDEDLLLPDGLAEVVFNRGTSGFERWRLGASEDMQWMEHSYLIGGRCQSVNTRTRHPLQLAGFKLDARFLRAIIGTPLAEFRDGTLSLAEHGDARLRRLEESVANARGVENIVALFDNFLLASKPDTPRVVTAVDALVERIRKDSGATPILAWARAARVDPRTLERGFCANLGMTPKQFARVIRFKHQYQRLIAPRTNRTSLSARLDGFYDQAHFNREFRHFTGTSPGARLAGKMPQGTSISDHLLVA